MRVVQPVGDKGSLKWIQRAVARRPDLLQPPGLPDIRWLSPLVKDEYAEYRDLAFLKRLDLGRLEAPLSAFWPQRGAQWDALGMADGRPVLVEAKAYIGEMLSPGTQAMEPARSKINAAFQAVRADLGVTEGVDWSKTFYQIANRFAHLWWLRQHDVEAVLLFVGFVGDTEMKGPATPEAWQACFEVAIHALGLPKRKRLASSIYHVWPDVALLE